LCPNARTNVPVSAVYHSQCSKASSRTRTAVSVHTPALPWIGCHQQCGGTRDPRHGDRPQRVGRKPDLGRTYRSQTDYPGQTDRALPATTVACAASRNAPAAVPRSMGPWNRSQRCPRRRLPPCPTSRKAGTAEGEDGPSVGAGPRSSWENSARQMTMPLLAYFFAAAGVVDCRMIVFWNVVSFQCPASLR
jgi:hypothetical protein